MCEDVLLPVNKWVYEYYHEYLVFRDTRMLHETYLNVTCGTAVVPDSLDVRHHQTVVHTDSNHL